MIRNLSIQQKLRLVMMVTSAAVLLLACAAFVVADFVTLQGVIRRDLTTLGDVMASNSTAALTFGDQATGNEVLSALKAKPSIVEARILTLEGKSFAAYSADGATVHKQDLELVRDIKLNGEKIGTLYLVSNHRGARERIQQYLITASAILILSLVVAFLLSSKLQQSISGPIKELARVAGEVTSNANYAARVSMKPSGSELGSLIVAFNRMLAEIQRRDDTLEREVQSRTAELFTANLELKAARDIAELAATRNEELFNRKRVILDSTAEGILGLDTDGVTTFMNQSAARILGWPAEQIVGHRLHDFVHQSDGKASTPASCAMCSASIEPNVRAGRRESLVHRAGTLIPIEYTATTIIDHWSQPSGVVITFRDITEQLAIDRMKSEFVSTVSHELRTPLTSIRGSLGLLASGKIGELTERAQRMLHIAVTNTDRLVRLINDILDLERINSDKVQLSREAVDPFDVMTESVEGIQAFADRAGVRVEVDPPHETMWGDRDRIIQTLTNLLSNAVKFSPRDSTVRLSGHVDGGSFTFVIADEGRGIPASHVESIFERFKQVDSSDSRNKNGTGLGLAICKSIVVAHGGRIWAESEEGHGTVFRFTIPLRDVRPVVDSDIAAAESHANVSEGSVLVIEDDTDLARVITTSLRERGIAVRHVLNGRDAIAACRESRPRLIVLDLALPKMNGFEVVQWMRTSAALAHTPLIVYSASEVGVEDQERLRLGPTIFLTKSRVSLEHFEKSVIGMLDGATTAREICDAA